MRHLRLLAVLVLALLGTVNAVAAQCQLRTFVAPLRTADPVNFPNAGGIAIFQVQQDGSVTYTLRLHNVDVPITGAHIHHAIDGDPLITMCGLPELEEATCVGTDGVFTGTLEATDLTDLAEACAEEAVVNVHWRSGDDPLAVVVAGPLRCAACPQ